MYINSGTDFLFFFNLQFIFLLVWQALQGDHQVLDGLHPDIPGLLVLSHQVQLMHVWLRVENQGEGSFIAYLSKPGDMLVFDIQTLIQHILLLWYIMSWSKDFSILWYWYWVLTCLCPPYPQSCWRYLSDIHPALHRYPSGCSYQNLEENIAD